VWGPLLAAKTGAMPLWRYAEKTQAARKYRRLKRVRGQDEHNCVHCHEVQRTAIDSYFMKRKKLPDKMLWVYPHPSIVGLVLEREHCARVATVEPGSAADKGGLKPGDDIVAFAKQPLLSVADFQWVLHNSPDEGATLLVDVRRGEQTLNLSVTLPPGWRRAGDFGWRYRVAGYAFWLWSGVTLTDRPGGVFVSALSPGWFKRPNRNARRKLRRGDLIVKVDGKPGWTRSTYIAYLMRERKPGSKVKLVVQRAGETLDIEFKLPDKRPEVLGY